MRHKITTQQVRKIKTRAAAISYGSVSVNKYGELVEVKSDFDKRIIRGYGIIWGDKNLYGEIFVKGCCAKSIREHGPGSNAPYQIKFLNQHSQAQAMALFAVLKEDDIGLYFETVPLDNVSWADDAIEQMRSGTINNFSHGWNYVWDKIEYDDTNDAIVLLEIDLFEISPVSIPAGMNTYCVRSVETPSELYDDIEDFIHTIPKKDRLQARNLFAQQKALLQVEPVSHGEPLNEEKPPIEKAIDYEYLLNNLKLFQHEI